MIISFKCKETAKIYSGIVSSKMAHNMQNVARRKLRMLNNANNLNDLRIPPNNRLKALLGDRKGQYSIRVNNKYRICFIFENSNSYNVEIVDYH